jgi:hypothetical protein
MDENKEKGEKAELPTLGEVAEIEENKQQMSVEQMSVEQNDAVSKRTLKIWDVPTELANKFISTARGSYANKSWLYLQDIMRKANLYDEMVSSGRLEDHEKRIIALEEYAERMNEIVEETQKEEINKKPKTFGGD